MTHYGICAVGWRVTATRLFRASAGTLSKHRKGLSLGTALTLPGAAASPNMGYHSSPALSVLLTLFNVRLGGWYGNPGPAGADSFWRVGPTVAVKPLLYEALSLADAPVRLPVRRRPF
jgi:hypothetical protein